MNDPVAGQVREVGLSVPTSPGKAEDLVMTPCFSCHAVSVEFNDKKRGTRTILADIDFEVPAGQFISILGESGVGKSTLLRVLGGLHAVGSASSARYQGQPIGGPPDRVVTVFQQYANSLLPWRTVERNVALGLEGKLGRDERRARVQQALAMVGLADRGRDYPSQLSGGMQQRVQIARALVMQPLALLLDEPFGALDAMTKSNLQDSLRRIHRETGATTIFVTHDIDEAVYLSDRILVLVGSPGRIGLDLQIDLPDERDQVTTKELPRYLQLRHQVYAAIRQGRDDVATD